MKAFNVPEFYRSPIISKIKQYRKLQDPRKRDNSPTLLDFGAVQFLIARHFGFCYGVENAIEISFKALDENPGKHLGQNLDLDRPGGHGAQPADRDTRHRAHVRGAGRRQDESGSDARRCESGARSARQTRR